MRMDTESFGEILAAVAPHIERQDTNFRRAIHAEERLAMTIRFLATGNELFT